MDAWQVPLSHVRRAIDRSALYFCGFPTLQHIKHKVSRRRRVQGSGSVVVETLLLSLARRVPNSGAVQFYRKKSGVVVFQQSSRGENTILDILPSNEADTVSRRLHRKREEACRKRAR